MTDFVTFPDLEAVVSGWLRSKNITGIGTRWYSSLPEDAGSAARPWPIGVIKRIGGSPAVRRYLDAANIQIDVWGNDKGEARDIAAKARTALMQLEGQAVTSPVTAFVSGIEDALGLTWQPDPDTGRDRYLFSVIVYAR